MYLALDGALRDDESNNGSFLFIQTDEPQLLITRPHHWPVFESPSDLCICSCFRDTSDHGLVRSVPEMDFVPGSIDFASLMDRSLSFPWIQKFPYGSPGGSH